MAGGHGARRMAAGAAGAMVIHVFSLAASAPGARAQQQGFVREPPAAFLQHPSLRAPPGRLASNCGSPSSPLLRCMVWERGVAGGAAAERPAAVKRRQGGDAALLRRASARARSP